MKRKLLVWVSLISLGLLALSCAPAAAPTRPANDSAPRQEAKSQPGQQTNLSSPAASGDAKAAPGAPAAAPGRSADATAGAPGNGAAPNAYNADRMIIYNSNISMEVKDSTDSLDAVAGIAQKQGGYVVNSTFRYEGERKVATVTIRVPSLTYQATLAELRRLAIKVQNEDSKAQDVTEEYTDLQAQLRNLEATEAQYLEFLKRAQSIDEVLKVQARISETRAQIERIKGRTTYLERTTDMAAITISLFSKDGVATLKEQPPSFWQTPAEAFQQSLVFLARVATFVAVAVSFFWWLILLLGAAYFVWRTRYTMRPMPVKKEGE